MRPCGRCGQAVENNVALCVECDAAGFAATSRLCAPGTSSRWTLRHTVPDEGNEGDSDVTMVYGAMFSVVGGLFLLGWLALGSWGLIGAACLSFAVLLAFSAATGGTF